MKTRAILFDKDGTLFDFQKTWAIPFKAFLGSVVPQDALSLAADAVGFDLGACAFRRHSIAIAGTDLEVAGILAPFVGLPETELSQMLFEVSDRLSRIPVVPLRACLSQLAARHVLGLVTNAGEAPARVHLEKENILDLFDFVSGYDTGHGAKPNPGQLLAFADACAVRPEETLMVGDSRHDLLAAHAAGMVPVGVLTGVAGPNDLADLAEVVLPDIGHLADWLSKNDTNRRNPDRQTL